MAKLTVDGVTITKVTLDGVTVTKLNMDGTQVYSSGTVYENIYVNSAWTGSGIHNELNNKPDNHLSVYTVTDMQTIDYGDGTFGFLFNPENSAVSSIAFEYWIDSDGTKNNVGLVNGTTYRFECDVYTYDAGTGDGATDATRGGGPIGMTIDSSSVIKTVGQWTTHHVEFTVTSATYSLRIRFGTGLDGGPDTGKFEVKNPKLFDTSSVVTQTFTHSMLVWHGVNSAGMDASVPGGSITPLPIAAGEANVTRVTSIAGGAPQLHVIGTQDVGSSMTATFEGGISFSGTGVETKGTHTKFVGASDGDALYNYLAAQEGNNVDFDIAFTPFVPVFTGSHTITPYDGTTIAGYDLTNGGAMTPLPVSAGLDNIIHLTSTENGAPVLITASETGVGDTVTVKLDGGNLEFSAVGVGDGTNTIYNGGSDPSNAIFNYLVANATVAVSIQIIHDIVAVPSPNIHEMPVVDYGTQSPFLLHVDHTGDANDSVYDSTEFELRYDEDWSTMTNVSLEGGRLKCTVIKDTYKKGIQSGGNLTGDYDECYMTYEFEFADGFDFVLGGKLPGLSGRPGKTGSHADGCNPQGQDGGFSARMMFRPDGQLEGYFYHEDQPGSCGHQIDFVDGGIPFKVRNGTKYLMEIRVKMNTPGNRDGIVECKINGVQVLRKANFRFSNNGSHGVNHKFIQMWHGGNSQSWAPSVDSTFFMNHMTVSLSPLTYTMP